MKKIKNNTAEAQTWCGQEVAAGEYYTIQSHEESTWAHDATVIVDIANGAAIINNGEADIPSVAEAIDFLKGQKISLDELKDTDGNLLVRTKTTTTGWTISALPLEICTSEIEDCLSMIYSGVARTGVTQKIYDEDDVQITTEEGEINAVKTVIDFEPSYDYELMSGELRQKVRSTDPVRVWLIATPDVSEQNGGSKEIVGGINLQFVDLMDKLSVGSGSPKLMVYSDTNHTNKLRFIFKHAAGLQHEILVILYIYKA